MSHAGTPPAGPATIIRAAVLPDKKFALPTSQATSGKLCASLRSNPGLPEGVPCWNNAGLTRKNYPSSCSERQKSWLSEGVPCWNTAGMARKKYPSSCSARQKLALLTSQATWVVGRCPLLDHRRHGPQKITEQQLLQDKNWLC